MGGHGREKEPERWMGEQSIVKGGEHIILRILVEGKVMPLADR